MISPDISKEDVRNFKGLLDFLKTLARDGVTPLIEKQLLMMLDNAVPFFSSLTMTGYFDEVRRWTINKNVLPDKSNRRIYDIKYLKNPPADLVTKYGRCNLPGQSVFYSSMFDMTALSEMRPRIGDLVTASVWKLRVNEPLIYCPIFKNQPTNDTFNERMYRYEEMYNEKIKMYPENVREQIDALVQFVADAFTKYVHPSNHLDYIFSSYFADKIFNNFENGKIEAIYYPSVKEKLSFENVAIKPDVFERKYYLHKVKDSVITQDLYHSSGTFMSGLSDCTSFDLASGRILWNPDKIHQPEEMLKDFKYLYGVELEDKIP